MYYKIYITKTSKSYNGKDAYQVFDNIEEEFSTIEQVKQYLEYNYSHCKRSKMYIDKVNGDDTEHIGYIYHFNDCDISHNKKYWRQQDWVEVQKIQNETIIVN